jgi:polyisoprenoid-binding protein YceI
MPNLQTELNRHTMRIPPWLITGHLALLLLLPRAVLAQDTVKYSASPTGSMVKIEGTSTLHDWTMESKIVPGSLELDPKVQLDSAKTAVAGLDGNKLPMKVKVSIPVRSLKSYTTAMDNVYQDAMEEKKFPKIEYSLAELTVKDGEHKPGAPFEFSATGDLVVHGVTNRITMPVTIEPLEGNKLKIKGAVPLKMTSFGVKPPAPKLALGLIKTGDDIKASFEWLVVRKAEAAK